MKKNSWVAIVASGMFLHISFSHAADATANSALQQQLQTIQESMNQPSVNNALNNQSHTGTFVPPSPTMVQANAQQTPATSAAPQAPTVISNTNASTGMLPGQTAPFNPTHTPIPIPTPTSTPTNANMPPLVNANGAPPNAAQSPQVAGIAAPMDIQDLRDEAFARVTNNALPLSPSQIQILRNLYDATQKAAAVYPGVPPRPTSTSLAVNLSPGSPPPVIRLSSGFVTSLVFVDSTGSPWPIEAYSLGNPTAFNIQWDKKSNILLVQAITAHRIANMAVLLKGLNTPVMIDLNPGQAAMDVRVDLRIPGFGPEAKPSYSGLPGVENPFLLNLLDGIPPPGAKNLKASGCDECVWLLDGKLYLRTQYTVLSPAWLSTLSSADGTHVYEMEPAPLILATYNGKTIKLKIEGF